MENENKPEVNNEVTRSSNLPMVLFVVLLLLTVGYFFINSDKKIDGVAEVNGVSISSIDYDTQLNFVLESYKGQGDLVNEDNLLRIRKEVLDNLINAELLSQNAIASGVEVDTEDVEKQFELILTQAGGSENFASELAKNNLTEEQVRNNIIKQFTIDKYVLQNINLDSVVVDEEEIKQFYSEYVKAQEGIRHEDLPEIEEVKEQIRQEILNNKKQNLLFEFIGSLREKAKIEIAGV